MSLIKRLTVAQAFRIAEDEAGGCLTRKPPQPTVSAQSSLVRADACEGAVAENERLRVGLRAALDYLELVPDDSVDYEAALIRVRAALGGQ